jgi:hypothetical protein
MSEATGAIEYDLGERARYNGDYLLNGLDDPRLVSGLCFCDFV